MSRGFVNGFFAARLPICRHAVLRYGALPLTYLMYAPRPRALRALPDNEYAALIRLLQKKKTPQFVILAGRRDDSGLRGFCKNDEIRGRRKYKQSSFSPLLLIISAFGGN